MSAIHDLLIRGAEIVDGTARHFEGATWPSMASSSASWPARGPPRSTRGLVLAPNRAHTHDDRAMLSDGAMAPGQPGRLHRDRRQLRHLAGAAPAAWCRRWTCWTATAAGSATNATAIICRPCASIGGDQLRHAAGPHHAWPRCDLEREAAPADRRHARARRRALGRRHRRIHPTRRRAQRAGVIEVPPAVARARTAASSPHLRDEGDTVMDCLEETFTSAASWACRSRITRWWDRPTMGARSDPGAHRRADENAAGLPGLLSVTPRPPSWSRRWSMAPPASSSPGQRPIPVLGPRPGRGRARAELSGRHRHLVKAHPGSRAATWTRSRASWAVPSARAGTLRARPGPVPAGKGHPQDDRPDRRALRTGGPGRAARGRACRSGAAGRGQVADRATFAQPIAPSAGIVSVWTNGRPVWRGGRQDHRARGRVVEA